MNSTMIALTGFVSWTLFLLIIMESVRTKLVLSGRIPANGFDPANSRLSPFMQRLARAHANCLEGLPIFGGLMMIAVVSGKASITDPLAYGFLVCRVLQSVIHLSSVSASAVTFRFATFAVQIAIGVYWAVQMLLAS